MAQTYHVTRGRKFLELHLLIIKKALIKQKIRAEIYDEKSLTLIS